MFIEGEWCQGVCVCGGGGVCSSRVSGASVCVWGGGGGVCSSRVSGASVCVCVGGGGGGWGGVTVHLFNPLS